MKDNFKWVIIMLLCVANLMLGIYNLTSANKEVPTTYEGRYEIIRLNDTNYVVYDKETETVWQKFVDPSGGPTDYRKLDLPK